MRKDNEVIKTALERLFNKSMLTILPDNLNVSGIGSAGLNSILEGIVNLMRLEIKYGIKNSINGADSEFLSIYKIIQKERD